MCYLGSAARLFSLGDLSIGGNILVVEAGATKSHTSKDRGVPTPCECPMLQSDDLP